MTGMHRAWRIEHQKLQKLQKVANDTLDVFIKMQNSSNDACSSRLMESKRVLDGLLKDLKAIEEQVDSHEELLETETENLNITHNAIDAAESMYETDTHQCNEEREGAKNDLAMYNAELEELKQIAEPGVRYTHSFKVTLPDKGENFNAAQRLNNTALLEQGVFGLSRCLAFKSFSQHSKILRIERAKNLTCDEQREQLQQVFMETYIAVVNLIKDAKERGEDESCFDSAEAKRTSGLVPLTSQREQASARIEYSTQALAMLEPVLNLLKVRVDKLQKHIEETLTPECKEAATVSETLSSIRELIISLEKCPGRNDFKLQIPGDNETASAGLSNAPATATSALQKVVAKPDITAEASALQKLPGNQTNAPKPNTTSAQTVVKKPDPKAASAGELMVTTPHHHRRHKHGHDHARSEVQKHGEVHQFDDSKDSEISETPENADKTSLEDKSREDEHKDKQKKDGIVSITVESNSV